MLEIDALYAALVGETSKLKTRFLDAFIPANPEHTAEMLDHEVKAFSILCHAAFEDYVEAVSEGLMAYIEQDLLRKRITLATTCLLTTYGIKLEIPDNDIALESSCFDHIRLAFESAKKQHSKTLKDNHGVSAKYMRKLLIPVGINMPVGPTMDSLRKLAEARGSFAHTMAKLAHYGEYKRATKVLTPEEAKNAADDCLLICDEIRNKAKAICSPIGGDNLQKSTG